jgi:hypothetical protein
MSCLHYSPLFPVQDLKNVFEAADIDHSTKIGEHQEHFCWQAQLCPQAHYRSWACCVTARLGRSVSIKPLPMAPF